MAEFLAKAIAILTLTYPPIFDRLASTFYNFNDAGPPLTAAYSGYYPKQRMRGRLWESR